MSTIKTWEEREQLDIEPIRLPEECYMQDEIDELREALKAAQEERRSAILLGAEIERNYMALTTERDALVIDRDEWKEATILANQRFKTAEAKLSGAQEKINSMQQNMENIYVENKALQAKLSAIEAQEPVAWVYEDELPSGYPYDLMFPFSKVDGVRLFPIFAPVAPAQPLTKDYPKLHDTRFSL